MFDLTNKDSYYTSNNIVRAISHGHRILFVQIPNGPPLLFKLIQVNLSERVGYKYFFRKSLMLFKF